MTAPLIVLAVLSVLLGFIGTPFWPWFQKFLGGHPGPAEGGWISLMLLSSCVVFAGIGLGWWLYGRNPPQTADTPDALEPLPADAYQIMKNKYWIDEIYEHSIIAFNAWWSKACNWIDAWVWNSVVRLVAYVVLGFSWLNRWCDEYVVNLGFDETSRGLRRGGKAVSRWQDGRVQNYLRVIGLALAALVLIMIWGCGK